MKEETEWIDGEITLDIGGVPLDLKLTVPAKPTTVRRMLPVFQQMSNSFVGLAVDATERAGEKISCKAGCGACCRQPVPLAEPEAFAIAELVEEMPEPKRSEIKKRFDEACMQLRKAGWFERLDRIGEIPPGEQQQLVFDYFREGVPCPLLEEESCSIHERRPLACREYLVTSPAEHCSQPNKGNVKGINLLVKPSSTLCSITRSENLGPVANFVPLVLALQWASNFKEDETELTGEGWAAEFFKNLTRKDIPGFGGAPVQE
jgi:Fe-S-cluster containining protein